MRSLREDTCPGKFRKRGEASVSVFRTKNGVRSKVKGNDKAIECGR